MRANVCVFPLLLAALPCLAQPPGAEKAKEKGPDYYPLKVGSKWHYLAEAENGRKGLLLIQIAKIENFEGKDMARAETVMQGNVVDIQHLSVNDQGIFRNRKNEQAIAPPVCLLKYPVKEGEHWEAEIRVGDQQGTMTGLEGREEIQVPAGKYHTITTLIETTVNGTKISNKYWFAANVGIVKQSVVVAGTSVKMELIKYDEAK
jgi:hypothetical protein